MSEPIIEIALATYNGSRYLRELLDSLNRQSHQAWRIVARDDGSVDDTMEILNSYRLKSSGKLVLLDNPCKNVGCVENFSEIMKTLSGEYFMLCDQDDVWLDDKIEKTLKKMKELECSYGKDVPLLIHTDLRVVDKRLKILSESFVVFQNLNPRNADYVNRLLVENVVTGCTVMGNKKLRELAGEVPGGAIMHDWWLALVASTFGRIGFVPTPTMLYRQHGDNHEGAKKYDLSHILIQAYNVFFRKEQFKFSLKKSQLQACAFRNRYSDLFDGKTLKMLSVFCDLPTQGYLLSRYNIFRYRFLITGFARNFAFFFRM